MRNIFRSMQFMLDADGVGSGGEVQPDEGQGIAVESAEPVQPEEGQGQQGTPSLYEEALSSVPEEHRQYVESHFKEWDRKVSEKLESAANDRKAWEPYEELGLRDRFDPEQMSALVEIADALSNPDTAAELVRQLADEIGLDLSQDVVDDEDDDAGPSGDPEIDSLRAEIQELREFKESLSRQSREAEVLAALQSEYAEIVELHGKPFTEKEETKIASLAEKFAATSETPLMDAYRFISELAGDAEVDLIKGKTAEPAPAEAEGRASTAPEPVDDWNVAQQTLKARIHASL